MLGAKGEIGGNMKGSGKEVVYPLLRLVSRFRRIKEGDWRKNTVRVNQAFRFNYCFVCRRVRFVNYKNNVPELNWRHINDTKKSNNFEYKGGVHSRDIIPCESLSRSPGPWGQTSKSNKACMIIGPEKDMRKRKTNSYLKEQRPHFLCFHPPNVVREGRREWSSGGRFRKSISYSLPTYWKERKWSSALLILVSLTEDRPCSNRGNITFAKLK